MTANINYNQIQSVLFVCMGNICRSPTAEAVFKAKADSKKLRLKIDSAGTTGSHVNHKPDHRAQKAAAGRGYSLVGLKARKVHINDFEDFDLILAMDQDNFDDLIKIAPEHLTYKVKLFLDFANNFSDTEVPDPYYGGAKGFQYVIDLVEDASDGLIDNLIK